MSDNKEQEIDQNQMCGWIEFGCWTALAITPVLYWVNGPAVSQDQLVVRSLVVLVALVGGVGLRLHAWRRRRAGDKVGR